MEAVVFLICVVVWGFFAGLGFPPHLCSYRKCCRELCSFSLPSHRSQIFSSLLSNKRLRILALTQLSASAGATRGEAPRRNLSIGNALTPHRLTASFPACRGGCPSCHGLQLPGICNAIFKHWGMWEIVAFLSFQNQRNLKCYSL